MRKRRFLAIVAAFAISMTFAAAPMTALATEPGEEYEDTEDDELAEGEQTTVAEPGAESSGGTSATGSSGSSGNGTSTAGSSQGTAKSSDSSLAYLGISPGSLSPSFSAGTFEYTAAVDANVTAVSIPARTNSSKAVIASVSGAKSIKPGTNTVKVVVEAENGSTSTYTITVQCGSPETGNAVTAQPENPAGSDAYDDTAGTIEGEITGTDPEGEITGVDDTEETKEDSEVTFDSNGYLIYEGNAYIPSEKMPAGEYVSLDKYNKLYEQAQAEKEKSNRFMIIFVVVAVLLLIVVLNLVLKLRDVRQDAKLGISGIGDDDMDELSDFTEKKKESKPKAAPKAAAKTAEKTKAVQKVPEKPKTAAKTPEKRKAANADENLEILDLNDL